MSREQMMRFRQMQQDDEEKRAKRPSEKVIDIFDDDDTELISYLASQKKIDQVHGASHGALRPKTYTEEELDKTRYGRNSHKEFAARATSLQNRKNRQQKRKQVLKQRRAKKRNIMGNNKLRNNQASKKNTKKSKYELLDGLMKTRENGIDYNPKAYKSEVDEDLAIEVANRVSQSSDLSNQTGQGYTVEVVVDVVWQNWLKAAAQWPSLTIQNRTLFSEKVTVGSSTVGVPWLAWVTLCYDLITRASKGSKSIFEECSSSYRRLFYQIMPVTRDGFSWVWRDLDFFGEFDFNRAGPDGTNLAWTTGADSNVTGRALLANSFPALTEDQIMTFGIDAAMRVFQRTLPEGTKLVYFEADNLPSYLLSGKRDASAFMRCVPDNNPDFPLLCSSQLEAPFYECNADLAALGLASPLQTERSGLYVKKVIQGCSAFFHKILHPDKMWEEILVLLKEINIQELLTNTLTALITSDQLKSDNNGVVTIAQPANSNLLSVTMGQFWTHLLAKCCDQFSLGGTIASLSGAPSGSAVLGGGSQYFVQSNVFSLALPLLIQEMLSEFSPQYLNLAPFEAGSDVPLTYVYNFLSLRGTMTGGNPYNTDGSDNVLNFVSTIYPVSTITGAYAFKPYTTPGIPNDFIVTTPNEMFFEGAGPHLAFIAMNAVWHSQQASVYIAQSNDKLNSTNSTFNYFTGHVEFYPMAQGYDPFVTKKMTAFTNRYSMSVNLIEWQFQIFSVWYATDVRAFIGYTSVFKETAVLLDPGVTPGTLITQSCEGQAHQRAGDGNMLQFTLLRRQGLGGGLFPTIVSAVGKIGRVLSVGLRALGDGDDDQFHKKMIRTLSNDPNKYGMNAALRYAECVE